MRHGFSRRSKRGAQQREREIRERLARPRGAKSFGDVMARLFAALICRNRVESELRGGGILLPALPVPVRGLNIVLRDASAMSVQDAQIGLGAGMSSVCALLEPFRRLGIILRHAGAIGVDDAESALREDIALISRSPKPCRGLSVILRHAGAVGIQDAESTLVRGTVLIGGFLEPSRSLAALRHHFRASE